MQPEDRKQFREALGRIVDKTSSDEDAMRKALRGVYPDEEIKELVEDMKKINETKLIKMSFSGLIWSSKMSTLSRTKFYDAVRRQYGLAEVDPDTIAAKTIKDLTDRGFYPTRWTDTKLTGPIPAGKPLGHTLTLLGALGDGDIEAALSKQRAVESKSGVRIKLGALMLFMGIITFGEYIHALAIQKGVAITHLDDILEQVISREAG